MTKAFYQHYQADCTDLIVGAVSSRSGRVWNLSDKDFAADSAGLICCTSRFRSGRVRSFSNKDVAADCAGLVSCAGRFRSGRVCNLSDKDFTANCANLISCAGRFFSRGVAEFPNEDFLANCADLICCASRFRAGGMSQHQQYISLFRRTFCANAEFYSSRSASRHRSRLPLAPNVRTDNYGYFHSAKLSMAVAAKCAHPAYCFKCRRNDSLFVGSADVIIRIDRQNVANLFFGAP